MHDKIGSICSFYPARGSVVLCRAKPDAKKYAGVIIACEEAPPPPGWTRPDYTLTIRGRTAKTMEVSAIFNYVTIHPSWQEAISAT